MADEPFSARIVGVDEFPYSDKRHYPAFIYLIWWPTEDGVIAKAGISRTTRRWKHFLGRGARVAGLWQCNQWVALESQLHERLSEVGTKAYESRAEGLPLLGTTGGHTECYRLTYADAITHLPRIALEVTHG